MVERGGKWDCTRIEATRHSMGPDLSFVICQWSVVSGQWGSREVGILASLPKWSFCAKKPRALGSGRLNGALGQLKRGYRPQWGGNVFRPEWGSNNLAQGRAQ